MATYGQVARAAGQPGAARLVAAALRESGGLPWHRVLGAGGRVRAPGEIGREQIFRLRAEGVTVVAAKVRLRDFQASDAVLRRRRA